MSRKVDPAVKRERDLARMKAWREANRERFYAVMRRWREANREREREKNREWRATHKAERAAYRLKNRARISEQKKASRRRNIEASLARDRRYYAANTQRIKANVKAWIAKNHERNRLNKNLNYNKRRAAGELSKAQWAQICLFYGNACAECRASDRPLTIDHYIPIAKGGTHDWKNVWPLCLRCNQTKHMKVPAGAPPHVNVLMLTIQLQKEA